MRATRHTSRAKRAAQPVRAKRAARANRAVRAVRVVLGILALLAILAVWAVRAIDITDAVRRVQHWVWQRYLLLPAYTRVLLLAALVLRLILIPFAAGQDFRAYAQLSAFTLRGRDVYALAPSQYLLPWAYFPLCLDMFTVLRWLGVHVGVRFLVVGKLPIIAGDLAVGALVYAALRRAGVTDRVATLGLALYLFNPLVLLNGAFLGRFDSIALALLLLALRYYRTRLFVPFYALAIAAKTFPLFLLPLFALGRDRQPPRRLLLAVLLVLLLALPYIVLDPTGMVSTLLAGRGIFGRLSWYSVLFYAHWLTMPQVGVVMDLGLLVYPVAMLAGIFLQREVKVAFCLTLFVLLYHALYEQYLLWPLPFLIILGLRDRDRLALWLIALYTVAGILENEYTWWHQSGWYSLDQGPLIALNVALGLAGVAFAVARVRPTLRSFDAPLQRAYELLRTRALQWTGENSSSRSGR